MEKQKIRTANNQKISIIHGKTKNRTVNSKTIPIIKHGKTKNRTASNKTIIILIHVKQHKWNIQKTNNHNNKKWKTKNRTANIKQ